MKASLLFLSICLNVALAVATFHVYRKPALTSTPVPSRRLTAMPTSQSNRLTSFPAQYSTNDFRWRQIESTNYDEYVSNLRAVGCPEKTLRDVIVADFEKSLAEQKRETGSGASFWMAGKKRRTVERLREQQLAKREAETTEWLRRLLGPDVTLSRRLLGSDRMEEQAVVRFFSGPMSEAAFQRTVKTIEKYEALKSEIQSRARGILTDDDEAALRNLGRAASAEYSGFLTPQELEEITARAGAMGMMNHDTLLEMVQLSSHELRQIALASAGSRTFALFDWDDATPEEQQKREVEVNAKIAALLGPERFADFERVQDSEFRQMFEVSKANGLPKATAVRIYEVRNLAVEELQRIRNDASLDESTRQQLIQNVHQEAQRAVSTALGPNAYQDYLSRGGAWITNSGKL